MIKNSIYTSKNRSTRISIGETLITIMKKVPFEKIKMRSIAKYANVSHVTLYKYYDSKESILRDYLSEMISKYLSERVKNTKTSNFQDYENIFFFFNYFDRYAEFFKTMHKSNLHHILLESINDFMEEHLKDKFKKYTYGLYYYAGALLNTFLKWELKEDKKESPKEIANVIYKFSNPSA